MRHRLSLGIAILLFAAAARADLPPIPDRGPASITIAGLHFALQWTQVPVFHYSKKVQHAVLAGCDRRHANCRLARARNLIGMEVMKVDGQFLDPAKGRIRQIANAFRHTPSDATVSFEFASPASRGKPVAVSFTRR